jgi:predicted phage tail component-like protein
MIQDYIGFTYNGKHSIRDLKIYRTSSGRYDDNITATMTDKTIDVPGGDGQYYFGTTFKNRTFIVAYAFENLKEADIAEIKRVFSGDGIHELVFDERPYKVWSAKVTGTASMKHLCFEEDGERIYKGEGSITFTCYYPFARTPKKLWTVKNGEYVLEEKDGRFLNNYNPTIYTNLNEWSQAAKLLKKEEQWIGINSTSPYQVSGEKSIGVKVGFKPFFQISANQYIIQ